MKIAVTTPTGNIGSKLVDHLLQDGSHEVILLTRSEEKVADAVSRGAVAKVGDLTDQAYVNDATKGVEALFWANPASYTTDDFEGHQRKLGEIAVNAIKTNKIGAAVFVSSLGAQLGTGVGPINGFKDVEKMFRESGASVTILRPTFFMENFMMSLQEIAQEGSVYLPIRSEASVPMIATSDIATVAYNVLTRPAQGVRVMPLHGPKDYTFGEAAETIGRALGKEVKLVTVEPEQTKSAMQQFGISAHAADVMIELYDAMDKGRVVGEKPRSAETTTPTTLDQWAKEVMAPVLKQGS
ncbi:NmrA family NAD(P)-binding protein [bacterium]|nr:NmrA family NAD(P)-binding protein [bacterium]